MAVYREGYHIVESLEKQHRQIWSDAADCGVPVCKGDANWNAAKQLVEWYGVKGTRSEHVYGDGKLQGITITQEVMLMDEWAVSDERKTVKEATEIYRITFTTTPRIKGYEAIITVDKIK